jgi:hypothetical protein
MTLAGFSDFRRCLRAAERPARPRLRCHLVTPMESRHALNPGWGELQDDLAQLEAAVAVLVTA